VILLFSLVVTIAFLVVYSPAFEKSPSVFYRKMRELAISWESIISIGVRACVPG
jgi:hypothetical protein